MIYCRICMPLTHSNCCYSWVSHLLRFALIHSKQMLGNKSTKVCEKMLFKRSSVHTYVYITGLKLADSLKYFESSMKHARYARKHNCHTYNNFFLYLFVKLWLFISKHAKKCLILNFIILIIHTWPLFLLVNG